MAANIALQNNFLSRLKAYQEEIDEYKDEYSTTYVNSLITEIEMEMNAAREAHNKLVIAKSAEATRYLEENTFQEIRSRFHKYYCTLLDCLPPSSTPKTEEHSNLNATIRPQTHLQELRLPKINLPHFSGAYDEWMNYKNLFTSLVHNSVTLEPMHKLHYLMSSLKGDALDIIKNLKLNDENYEVALDMLESRFQHNRRLVRTYFKRLFKPQAMSTESSNSIKQLIINIRDCKESLHQLKVELPDYVIIYHMEEILPYETLKDWEQSLGTSVDLPNLNKFLEFLETRFRVLEMTESNTKTSKKVQKSFHIQAANKSTNSHKSKTKEKGNFRNKNSKFTRKLECLICKGEHFFSKCDEYSRMSISDRFGYVNRLNRCTNCLSDKHTSIQCQSRFSCRVCKEKHHSTLHRYEGNQHSDNSGSVNRAQPATHHNYHIQSTSKLLGTARVKAINASGCSVLVRALVDPCSTDNYISSSTVKSLRLKKYYEPTEVITMGSPDPNECPYRVRFRIESLVEDFSTEITAAVIDKITTDIPAAEIPLTSFGHLTDLPLGDPFFNRPCTINILLGVDVHTQIKRNETEKYGNLMAENTHLGYLIRGSANDELPRQSRVMLTQSSSCELLREEMKKFWETEELITPKPQSPDEILCEEIFQSSLKRGSDGHLSVKLPFKLNEKPSLGQTRFQAVQQFLSLEKRLESKPEVKEEYHSQMRGYIDSKHLVKARNVPEAGKLSYVPHHAVLKPSSTTTTVRVVFNFSCKSSDGTSLNDHLMTGPKLQIDIRNILFAWRQYPIPLTADIEKMYRMFNVDEEHQDYQRIIWRFNPSDPLEDWKLTTITFGSSSAPYQAIRLLNYIADECKESHPLASKVIKSHFYVDDCIAGGFSINETLELKSQLVAVLKSYGLNLRKFNSSSQEILDQISPDLLDSNSQLVFDETQFNKTLGVCWSRLQDSFLFNIDLTKYSMKKFTKREVLSMIARLYDPLGFVSPCTMLSKQVMQRIWQTSSGWDEQVEEPIRKDFSNFLDELHLLRNIRIPRWINLTDATSDVTIFGFCDASLKGYGSVIYLLNPNPSNPDHKLTFLSSKTKVADLKYESIARLELNGAVLLAELIHWAIEQLRPRNTKVLAFCDSQIVLAWLQTNPAKWKTYVANRATQILNLVNKEDWHYVDTKNNPADFASRGLLPSEIVDNEMWWYGPKLENLRLQKELKLSEEEENIVKESVNKRSIVLHTKTIEPSFISKYSNHSIMLRKTRYMAQFPVQILKKLKLKLEQSSSTTTYDNLQKSADQRNQSTSIQQSSSTADDVKPTKLERLSQLIERLSIPENIIFRVMQYNSFREEITALNNNQQLSKKSKLKVLFPFIDKFGILRVGGRLQNSELTFSQKHPIILVGKHQVTKNIIVDAHERTLHGAEALTLSYLRNRYHIPRATEAVKQVIHNCEICFRYAKHQQSQLMGSLPAHRVQLDRAFINSGVDYAGPITTKAYPGRCQRFLKSYIAVFVCLGSKALHLELVSDLSSSSFLAAFKRFTSRRGRCHNLYSDNGTNFVENLGTKWHFIPPATPHFGGLWEAGVKSVKTHLKKTVGTSRLTYEELLTILVQIEGVLNSRPLCPMTNNPNDYNVLTPAHCLIGEPIIAPIEPIYDSEAKPPTNRWNHLQFTFQRFVRLWKRDYLQMLQTRPKNQFETNEFRLNDLVLLAEDDVPATLWPRVIIEKLHPGQDGLIRVVTVRTSKGKSFKRPIIKLRKLPCNKPYLSTDTKQRHRNLQPIDRMRFHQICRACFQVTHHQSECLSLAVVACTNCYRLNFFTTNCICSSPAIEPGQVLRMVGTNICRPFMDVSILSLPVPALINTTLLQTKVDENIARHIMSLLFDNDVTTIPTEIEVPFDLGTKTFRIKCKVENFEETDIHIQVGMDFLSQQHLRIKSGGVTLYGHCRWATSQPDDVQFAYNTPYGRHLRRHLDRIGFERLPQYSRRSLPDEKRRNYFSKFRDHRRN